MDLPDHLLLPLLLPYLGVDAFARAIRATQEVSLKVRYHVLSILVTGAY